MFIDEAKISVKAGDGGKGSVSFRREKYVPRGGPDGGDGGKGGNIYMAASRSYRTLLDFKYRKKFIAEPGQRGEGAHKSGKSGQDLIILLPCGTVVRDAETKEVIADLVTPDEKILVVVGGRGGKGNSHFKSSTNQAPKYAQPGEPGGGKELELELKLIADVGLIGFPNAGKSTLLSVISAAHPKIASYPFTTLSPNLGVVKMREGDSFVVADIPGIIEGAHEGTGLGDKFLRHVERTKLLVHIIDAAAVDGRDPLSDYKTLNKELKAFSGELAKKPQIIALNKIDLTDAAKNVKLFKAKHKVALAISGVTQKGVKELLQAVEKGLRNAETIKKR